jgi:hypothetical protein
VRTKKGNKLHSKGNKLPFLTSPPPARSMYAGALAVALRAEVERPGYGAKTIMNWTGASERAVKGWLGGDRGPSGQHLIALIAYSDAVLAAVMQLAKRDQSSGTAHIVEARRLIGDAMLALEKAAP